MREGGVYGADTLTFVRRFRADKAIIGASGVARDGITDADSASCAVKRAMIERAARTLLVADSSKYDVAQFERVCPLSDVDDLVSEAPPPKALAAVLKRAGTRVVVAR